MGRAMGESTHRLLLQHVSDGPLVLGMELCYFPVPLIPLLSDSLSATLLWQCGQHLLLQCLVLSCLDAHSFVELLADLVLLHLDQKGQEGI